MKNVKLLFRLVPCLAAVFFLASCTKSKGSFWSECKLTGKARTIDIVVFGDFPAKRARIWCDSLKRLLPEANIKQSGVLLPAAAWYEPRKRYLATELLDYMSSTTEEGHLSLGLTVKDISLPYKGNLNWGVMGLSYMPGNSSVVSTFRLKEPNIDKQGFKLCLHEMGHAEGLDHCESVGCYMRDAKGKNHLDGLIDFCPECKERLKNKGWRL